MDRNSPFRQFTVATVHLRRCIPLVALFAFALPPLEAQAPRSPAPALIPARYTKVTDSLGFVWDVTTGGNINSGSNAFMGSFAMSVDGDGVSFQTSMMSADGQEYFYSTNLDGLRVVRRVRVNVKDSHCRYLETFTNTSGAPRNVEIIIRARLRGRMQASGNDAGDRAFPFPDKDSCIIVGGNPKAVGQPQPTFVWALASPGAKVRPTVQIEQSTYIKASYPLVIPPGATVSIVHAAAQRTLEMKANGGTDGKKIAEIYAGMSLPKVLAGVPAKERKDFINYTPGTDDGDEASPGALGALQALLEAADISRDKADTVIFDAGSKVTGIISGSALTIQTAFGKAEIPFADIAGLAGGGGVQRTVRVFLRDGEILAGAVTAEKMTMTTDGGLAFDIVPEQIQLLALRKETADGRPPESASALLTTQHGDCLAIAREPAGELDAATPWGTLRVPLTEIASLDYVREPFPGHRLTLRDRSRLPVILRGDEWELGTVRFGKAKIAPQSVRDLRSTTGKLKPSAADGAICELAGEHRLAGVIDLAELHLASAKSTTPIDSKAIAMLTRDAGEGGAALVKIKLADGQELSGRLVETTLPIRSGDRVWRVPIAHILSVAVPPPAKPKEDTTPAAGDPVPIPLPPARPKPRTDEIINAPPEKAPAPAPTPASKA